MKRILLTLMTLLGVTGMWADGVSVADVEVKQGGTAILQLYLDNSSGTYYRDFSFTFNLPTGITRMEITAGENLQAAAGILPGSTTIVMCVPDQEAVDAGTVDIEDYYIKKSGVLLNIEIKASEDLAVGTELEGSLIGFELSDANGNAAIRTTVPFKITIIEPLVLDEESTEVPEATSGVEKFTVKRTIKANEWSTICLPFNMTEAQTKEVFGDDVEFAEFSEYEVDDEDEPKNIDLKFETSDLAADGFIANYPYIIKTSKDITEFEVTAQVEPEDEKDLVAEYAEGKGAKRKVYGTFQGTYHAGTVVPENALFINGNKFWYSKGKTKMKAFRGYFVLDDVLASVANAKIGFVVNDEATSIEGLSTQRVVEGVYDLSGRKIKVENGDVNTLQKGVYIIDGKKVTIK